MTQKAAERTNTWKPSGIGGLCGFKENHVGDVKSETNSLQLRMHFNASIRPGFQVDDVDLPEEGVECVAHSESRLVRTQPDLFFKK